MYKTISRAGFPMYSQTNGVLKMQLNILDGVKYVHDKRRRRTGDFSSLKLDFEERVLSHEKERRKCVGTKEGWYHDRM